MKGEMITEKQFASQIEGLFKLFGWKYYHTWNSWHSVKGFPDYVAIRGDRLLFIELKSEKGKLTEAQKEWYISLSEVDDIEVYDWKPHQWELIVGCLQKEIR